MSERGSPPWGGGRDLGAGLGAFQDAQGIGNIRDAESRVENDQAGVCGSRSDGAGTCGEGDQSPAALAALKDYI